MPDPFFVIVLVLLALLTCWLLLRVSKLEGHRDTLTALARAGRRGDRTELDGVREELERVDGELIQLRTMLGTEELSLEGMSVSARIADLIGAWIKLERRLDQVAASTGGLWQTAQGEVMQIRDMSDSHLANVLAGGFGGQLVREQIRAELRRRRVDVAVGEITGQAAAELSDSDLRRFLRMVPAAIRTGAGR